MRVRGRARYRHGKKVSPMRIHPRSMMDFELVQRLHAFGMPEDQKDALIAWKAGSIAVLKHYSHGEITEEHKMQRQFTIELRVDFADPEKLEPMKQVLQQAARHALATARLISDNPKSTQVALFSEDFMSGHETIALLDDVIQDGLNATGEKASGSDTISSELAGIFNDG